MKILFYSDLTTVQLYALHLSSDPNRDVMNVRHGARIMAAVSGLVSVQQS